MRNNYLIIRKRALSLDSFRYTDQRQYIAKRDDGALQPCIHSMVPLFLSIIGVTFLSLVAMAVLMVPHDRINHTTTTPIVLFIAFVMTGIGSGLLFGDYRLMYAVGPKCYDGRRRFWFEEEEERKMLAQKDDVFGDGKPVTPLRKFYRSLKLAFSSRSPR
jgi:hypothetical protein